MAFRLVLLGLAFARADDLSSAVDADNECSDDGSCALNALQQRHSKQSDGEMLEVDHGAVEQFSVYWVRGNPGYNCDQVCATRQLQGSRMACDARAFGLTPDAAGIMKAAQSSGTRCTATWANNGAYGHAFDNVPAICMAPKCGVDPQGLCAYSPRNAATCAGPAPTGYSRICPCNVATNALPVPAPQQHVSPVPMPAPQQPQYVHPAPLPAPQQPQYTPVPAPAKPEKCVTKTDVSCTMVSCSKTMGPTECKYKDGSWIHKRCSCKKGYCLKKNKCVRVH